VGQSLKAAIDLQFPFPKEFIELSTADEQLACPGVEMEVVDLVVAEIFGRDSQHIGLDSQVQVLGHQNDGTLLLFLEIEHDGEDAIVMFGGIQSSRKILAVLMVDLDAQTAF